MISKELLSDMLQDSISAVGIIKFDDLSYTTNESYIDFYTNDDELYYNINIYELAHKCKEWALLNGYVLNSGLQNNEGYENRSAYAQTKKDGDLWVNTNRITFLSSTEPEAIFKACKWILDNMKGSK